MKLIHNEKGIHRGTVILNSLKENMLKCKVDDILQYIFLLSNNPLCRPKLAMNLSC